MDKEESKTETLNENNSGIHVGMVILVTTIAALCIFFLNSDSIKI